VSETIFALSSGALPAGVSVIRISGPGVRFAFETMLGDVPPARQAVLRRITDGEGGEIDRGLALFFPGPASFTGEDCGELHLHGSRAVVARCLQVLGNFDEFRPAEAGEFSRRAFANGKMDLTEAEGLADLIHAETEAQRRAALDQAGGALRSLYEGWMKRLTHARAMLEAELDFADEADVPGSVSDTIWDDLTRLRQEMSAHLSGIVWGEIVRDGFRIALVGAPNAGKSTLLNRLADREVAIVSAIPGTTRDMLEVRLDLGGHLVLVTDTAGLRESGDEIELEGMRRAKKAVAAADLVLLLDDGSGAPELGKLDDAPSIWKIRTKSDLRAPLSHDGYDLILSARTGEGMDNLVSAIAAEIDRRSSGYAAALPNRERHRAALAAALRALDRSFAVREDGAELVAESLRTASHALGRITGHVDVEDLLGVIFSEFCVGK
jgi:small GTP-binding protein domain